MGSSSSNKVSHKNEFYQEAFGYENTKIEGININDTEALKTSKEIGKCSTFKFNEEIVEHADESGVVKPWLENVIPPSIPLDEVLSYPAYHLEIDHVFGFRTENARKNLFFFKDDQIIYSISSVCIIQNLDDYSQRKFGGFPLKENKECHDNNIMAIAFLKSDVSMIATGQSGLRPKILVWSPLDTEVVYAKFEQPKDSKLVSALAFDKDGHYLASFGKSDDNAFYVFDLRKKELYWNCPTSKYNKGPKSAPDHDDFLLDICFNPFNDDDEFCIVGVNKILFGRLANKTLKNFYEPKNNNTGKKFYCSCCFASYNKCLVGTSTGKVNVIEDEQTKVFYKKLGKGSIQNITFKVNLNLIFVSDSNGYVYILEAGLLSIKHSFRMDSAVKSLDITDLKNVERVQKGKEKFKIIMGLQNGDIVIKNWDYSSNYEVTYLKSHYRGSICGLAYVPEYKILTVGEDNQILLFNLRSKKCEAWGIINSPQHKKEKEDEEKDSDDDDEFDINDFSPQNRAKCIAYNTANEHVAIGINNGTISIRKNPKELDVKANNDFLIGTKNTPVAALQYTIYGDKLLVSTEYAEIILLDVYTGYVNTDKIVVDIFKGKKIFLNDEKKDDEEQIELISEKEEIKRRKKVHVTNFDFDIQSQFIQCATKDNKYIFINIDEMEILEDAKDCKNAVWDSLTCKFNYCVQGVFQGSTSAEYISAVCRANNKNLVVAGDDDFLLNLYNYPCITENPKFKKYRGHSGKITKILWNSTDSKIITIAKKDKAIIVWTVDEENLTDNAKYLETEAEVEQKTTDSFSNFIKKQKK